MARSEIRGAPYNPRRDLTEAEKRKLRGLLKKHGLFNALVWNERSGNLIAGHQRLSIIDALEGSSSYSLDVDVVDVDDMQEREMNIAHNNANAQGDYDLDKLGAMFKDGALDIEGTGFDNADIYRLFGDTPLLAHDDAVAELAQQLREASEAYEKVRKTSKSRDSADFFTIFVWPDEKQRDEAHKLLGVDDNRYQPGVALVERFQVVTSDAGKKAT